jgi:hypothetical protein
MKKKHAIVAIAMLTVLAALCTTASAGEYGTGCPFSNWYNGTAHGGIYIDVKGHYDNAGATQTEIFENVPAGREIVRFYGSIWLGSPSSGRVTYWNITINGHTDSYSFTEPSSLPFCNWDATPEGSTPEGTDCKVSCTGCGVCFVAYNASSYIKTGDNTITFWTSEQITLFSLLVVYENDSMPEMQYWIKEGEESPDNTPYQVCFPETANTGLIEPDHISSVEYFTHGYPHCVGVADWPSLNGNYIDAPNITYNNDYDDVFYYWTNIPPNYISSTSNQFSYPTLGNDRLMVAFLGLKYGPDLNVSSIAINPGDTRADEIVRAYINGSNNISAVVSNNGYGDAGAFDVCFTVKNSTSTYRIGCVEMAGLAAGESGTVYIDWTPTCANFSSVTSTFPYTSEAFWINVTVDCNCTDCPNCPDGGSNGKIAESDETNNTLSRFIPAIQLYSGYNVIGGVVSNGYRSKNYDCNLSEEPLTLFEYDSEIVGGGIAYNVSGEKIYRFAPGDNSTRIHHIDIPLDATVKKARLYVYWYDKWGNYNTYPTGCLANLSVNFSGTEFMPEVKYSDAKGFGYYLSPKGTYAYNVTSKVTGSGDYTAIIENLDPNPNNSTTLLGELLYVVYEGTAGKTTQLWTLEGNDLLMQGNVTHPNVNDHSFSVDEDEATATVAFPGTVDLAIVSSATLISVVVQGMAPGSNMLFNGEVIKTEAWNSPTEAYPNSKINVESVDVTANLTASGNDMGFLDTGTTGMQASNAFLVITYKEEEEEIFDTGSPANPYPSIFGTHNGTITVDKTITVNRMYTYPCVGTGGHTELVKIWNETTGDCAEAHWDGYIGDYHNISFNKTLILKKGVIYNYTIRTGSYPQIHHRDELEVASGIIKCTKFTDANGKGYNNWIPAIILY